jgi:hypothetical protein
MPVHPRPCSGPDANQPSLVSKDRATRLREPRWLRMLMPGRSWEASEDDGVAMTWRTAHRAFCKTLCYGTFCSRMYLGWTVDEALS